VRDGVRRRVVHGARVEGRIVGRRIDGCIDRSGTGVIAAGREVLHPPYFRAGAE